MEKERFLAEIAKVAYELYEKRGRAAGHELDDWIEAERAVMERHAGEIAKEAEAIRTGSKGQKVSKPRTTVKKVTLAKKSETGGATAAKKAQTKKTTTKKR